MIWMLLACAGDTAPTDSAASSDLTYYADVKPLVDVHCTRCHNPDGLGPSDFTDPQTVVDKAELISVWTGEGLMPPAASDPTCNDYAGSEHMVLDADEQAVLHAWYEDGAALGTIDEVVEVEVIDPVLSDADLELVLDSPYKPTFWDDSNPGNEYRCFVLDPELDQDVFLTAMHPIVDADEIVHHVVLTTADRAELGDEHTSPGGWDCIDGVGLGTVDQMIAGWAPGMMPIEFADGYGMKLPADQVLVIQMHYFGEPGVPPDQSGYAFRTTTDSLKQIYMAPLGIGDFSIPAGGEHTDTDTFDNDYPVSLDLWGVFPHMHQLGTAYSMSVEGDCAVEGSYDFDNQLTYMFDEPMSIPAGGSIEYSCTWDNDGSETVRYGERTDEEMCFFFSLISIAN